MIDIPLKRSIDHCREVESGGNGQTVTMPGDPTGASRYRTVQTGPLSDKSGHRERIDSSISTLQTPGHRRFSPVLERPAVGPWCATRPVTERAMKGAGIIKSDIASDNSDRVLRVDQSLNSDIASQLVLK